MSDTISVFEKPSLSPVCFHSNEPMMIVGLIALIVSGVLMFFSAASIRQKGEEVIHEVDDIRQTVHELDRQQASYSGLTSGFVASSGRIPEKWIDWQARLWRFSSAVSEGLGSVALRLCGVSQHMPHAVGDGSWIIQDSHDFPTSLD